MNDIGVVVAKSGLGDLDGPLQLGAGAVQVAPGGQDAGEVAELAANPAARLLARAVPTVRGCVPAMPARVSGPPVVAVAGVVPPPPRHQVQHEQQRKKNQQGHVQPPGSDRHRLGSWGHRTMVLVLC